MCVYTLGILAGDDIGHEIVPVAVAAMQAALAREQVSSIAWEELPIGASALKRLGSSLPETTLEALQAMDGWILGPVGHTAYPKAPGAVNPHPIIRKAFDLGSNVRPARALPGVTRARQGLDVVIVRENNEGFPPDRNMHLGRAEFMPSPDMALSLRVITRRNSQSVARTAFELARARAGKKQVTAVHKKGVFKLGCGLFLDACAEVALDYPDITLTTVSVDAFAMHLIMEPERFDVVVATNIFGDIISDEAAGLAGGLGMAPGLCVGPRYAMAQATHGSAPDIAGKGIANPFAMMMSGQMLLDWLGRKHADEGLLRAARALEDAVLAVVAEGCTVTRDLGGTASTKAMGEAVCARLAPY